MIAGPSFGIQYSVDTGDMFSALSIQNEYSTGDLSQYTQLAPIKQFVAVNLGHHHADTREETKGM